MTAQTIRIGDRLVGDGQPVYIAAEIGCGRTTTRTSRWY